MDYAGSMKAHSMTFGSWTIPARILIAPIAVCVFAAVPQLCLAAGPPAPLGAPFQVAQADTASGEGDEDEVPIPPNLLEPTPPPASPKEAAPDTTGAAAARHDSTRVSLPATPTEPETLRYVQPGGLGDPRMPPMPGPVLGTHTPAKARAGLFGLGPAIVILGLAVIHFLVLRTVGR
jgi:hypothetical protein